MLQKALDFLVESRRETKRLQEALKEQMEMTRELTEVVAKQELTVHEMGKQMVKIKKNMAEKLQRVREQIETIVSNAAEEPQRSTVPALTTAADVFYCTINASRIEDEATASAGTIRVTVENEVRLELDNPTWRCHAVTRIQRIPIVLGSPVGTRATTRW
ncbi:hypothetical protein FOMG_18971 [Fusarium oxysporum f. sp. melonis 26406]|uniref:Uncharacterized protein n=1 Tax=Fusarium oxysporum f. sp. melonis 26406 TaxID=1089452 RepID=W9YXL0_FUSOX|nr:hypothetical protein FOMG_18971 [Fusarium oxysporum f. sp. melonis 26406]